ncbi:MAG: alpha/beta fold hydrolase, partial [Planctomycetes bacterium]|nr:alpha/beta fold hydrolase [Planctomycetota bacterium]
MSDHVALFGDRNALVGIRSDPVDVSGPDRPAVVLLNAGLVHRVGPNRVHVKLSRRLAAAGHVVLRFDLSGLGDSPTRTDAVPFAEYAIQETRQALDYLEDTSKMRRIVLIGICSGADVAFSTAAVDSRVVGVVMINGSGDLSVPVGTTQELAVAHTYARYYHSRL